MPPKYFTDEQAGDLLPVAIVPADVAQQLPRRPRATFGQLTKAYFDTQSMLGSLTESASARAAIWMQEDDPTYNPYGDIQLADVPRDQIDSYFSGSRSAGETAIIQERLRKERENRAVIEAEGMTARTIGAAILSQGLDIAALAVGAGALSKGAAAAETVLGSAAKGAGTALAAEAGAEAVKQVTQYERTWTETAMNLAGAAFLGGAIPAATTGVRNLYAAHQKQLASQIAEASARAAGGPDPSAVTAPMDIADAAVTGAPYTVKTTSGGPISFIGKYVSPNGMVERLPEPVARQLRSLLSTSKITGANIADVAADSVEARLLQWDNEYNRFLGESSRAYKDYLRNSELGWLEKIKAGFGAQPRPDLMSEVQWDEYVGRIIQDGADENIASRFGYTPEPGALAAAKRGKALLDRAGKELYERGVFLDPPDANYFTRYWKIREIGGSQIEFKQDLLNDLPALLAREGREATTEELDEIAEDVIETLTAKHGNLPEGVRVNVGPLKGRMLKFDNQDAVVRKWAVQSASEVLDRYQRQVAPKIEMAKLAKESVEQAKLRSRIRSLESGEHIQKAIQGLLDRQAKEEAKAVKAAGKEAAKLAARKFSAKEVADAANAELDRLTKEAFDLAAGADAETMAQVMADIAERRAGTGKRLASVGVREEELLASFQSDRIIQNLENEQAVLELAQRLRGATAEKIEDLQTALAHVRKRDVTRTISGTAGQEEITAYYRGLLEASTDSKSRAKITAERDKAIAAWDAAVRLLQGGDSDLKDVSGISAWVPRAMKWNILTKMGRVTLSQFNDLGTLPLRYGMGNTYRGISDNLSHLSDPLWRENREVLSMFADALDTVTSSRMLSIAEMDQTYLRKTAGDIALDWMYRRAGTFSGFNWWSENFKAISGQLASSMIWRQATGKIDDAALPGLLQSVGLSADDLVKLGQREWIERGSSAVPNFAKWADDDLTRKFGMAVRQLTKATTNEPTLGMKPFWTRTVIGRAASQFKGFYFGFYEHTLGFMEQKWKLGTPVQKASLAASTSAFIGLGAMSHYLRESSYGREVDLKSGEFWINAADQSGLLVLFMEPNNMVESMSGNKLGFRPMMGIESPSGRYRNVSAIGALTGPSGQLVEDAFQTVRMGAGAALAGEPATPSFYKHLARLAPYNNALLFSGLYDIADKAGEITDLYDLPDEPRKEIPEMLGEKKSRRRKASGL